MRFLLLFFFSGFVLFGQQQTGTATTRGTCSPANTGNGNTFTITCGIGAEQGADLIKIVNKILANETDLKQFGGKIDEILKGVNDIKASSIPFRLTEQQKNTLVAGLTPFKGQKVVIMRVSGDHLGEKTAQDFVEVFVRSGWVGPDGSALKDGGIGFFGIDPVGIGVDVNDADVTENIIPAATFPLIRQISAIVPLMIPPVKDKAVQRGAIWLVIGRKQ
jgi:hypothetical protein